MLENRFQRKPSKPVSHSVANNVAQRMPNKTGLPDHLKSGIENLSGHSMDDVKVHYDSSRPAQLHAHAYAQGNQIHLAPGQEKHLPHEAWHVVQQKQGRVKPTMQFQSQVNINDDAGLEKEADVIGNKSLDHAQGEKSKGIGSQNTVQLASWGTHALWGGVGTVLAGGAALAGAAVAAGGIGAIGLAARVGIAGAALGGAALGSYLGKHKIYRDRKQSTASLINSIHQNADQANWTSANLIHCQVFQDDHRILNINPQDLGITTNAPNPHAAPIMAPDGGDPATAERLTRMNPIAHQNAARYDGLMGMSKASKDGEIRLIDYLDAHFVPILTHAAGPHLTNTHYRIEVMGPRATCEDCQQALSNWKQGLTAAHPWVEISIMTRWTEDSRFMPSARGNAGGMRSRYQSPNYGAGSAVEKDNVKVMNSVLYEQREPAPHVKNEIH